MGEQILDDHVRAAQEGDEAAFDALVRATYANTYSLAYQLTGNAEDADDVAQDTYLRAFRALARFRGDAAFPTWLYRITVNSALNLRAKRRRAPQVSLDDHRHTLQLVETSSENDPVARILAVELKDRVLSSLSSLPALLRQVVVLREVEGLPHSAIAERLGISETAAKVRLHRARQKLKTALSDEVESDTPSENSVSAETANKPAAGTAA
jgi:RNA polymerase sigma-70 factor, ECF subfamily